jgi:hypothetical protein
VATIRTVEREIFQVEGVEVRILHGRDRRDVRSDKTGIPGYRYKRGFPGARTVKDWIDVRFAKSYPGFDVEVVKPDGNAAHGGMRLDNLRGRYG